MPICNQEISSLFIDILTISVFIDKVTGMVLRGIFLLRKKEIDWFYEGGAAAIYPDGMFFYNSLLVYRIYCECAT